MVKICWTFEGGDVGGVTTSNIKGDNNNNRLNYSVIMCVVLKIPKI